MIEGGPVIRAWNGRTTFGRWACGLSIATLIAVLGTPARALAGPTPQLLQSTGAAEAELSEIPMTAHSFRARLSRIDRTAIRAAVRNGEALDIALFDDIEIRALPSGSKRLNRSGIRWSGVPERDPSGSIVLVERHGSVTGSVQVDGRLFMIRPLGAGRHVVEEIHRELMPTGLGDAVRAPEVEADTDLEAGTNDAVSAAPEAAAEGDLSNLKVLMLFTGSARKLAGGRAALGSLIELGVEQTNLALEASKVDARFELVAIKKVPGKETADMGEDLDALWYSDDGKFDKAHRLRERYDADFVQLIVGDADDDYCGIAYLPDVTAARAQRDAFGVTRADCISSNTIAHELGHNMGLAHDKLAAETPGQFRFSYGYCEPGGAFHTIMAYYSSCPSPQLLAYSTPRVKHNSLRVGAKGKADNARSINRVREYLEAFRGPTGQSGASGSPATTPSETPESTDPDRRRKPEVDSTGSGSDRAASVARKFERFRDPQ